MHKYFIHAYIISHISFVYINSLHYKSCIELYILNFIFFHNHLNPSHRNIQRRLSTHSFHYIRTLIALTLSRLSRGVTDNIIFCM